LRGFLFGFEAIIHYFGPELSSSRYPR
jgi:hypothetical protein